MENKILKDQNKKLSDEIYTLKNPLIAKPNTNYRILNILEESKSAMKRYTEKLRKENEKYAKQKQSKG